MYHPSAKPNHEGKRDGPSLVNIGFVWRYGGKEVFLTGSFTRWMDHVPMSPVEGCPTFFQCFCSLPPGLHQYKYYVDGEWRHDEHQPTMVSSYGIVNTLDLASGVDSVPSVFPSDTHATRMNMDVDGETSHLAIPLLDGISMGTMISKSGVQASGHRICDLLAVQTAYDLLPDSGKVIALDVNLPMKQSSHILREQGIAVAPLWDSSVGQFVGILTPLDFILILKELETHGSNITEEELESHTISAWKEAKKQIYGRSLGQLVHASPSDTLKDIALKLLENKISTIPIINSCSKEGSHPQLLYLASLSSILKGICRYFRHTMASIPILQQPVCELPLGTWVPKLGQPNGHQFATLPRSAPLSSALSLLVQAGVSSIPIVDDNDALIDIYSRSDITALAKDKSYPHIQLNGISIHQALQLGQEASSPVGYLGQRCQMCLRTDPLLKVMERLSNPGVRRVIVVEAGSNRVEGIISLRDVFRLLLS